MKRSHFKKAGIFIISLKLGMLNSGMAFAFDADNQKKQKKQEEAELDEAFLNFLAESTLVGDDAVDALDMLEAESIKESGFDSLEALSENVDIINRKGEMKSQTPNNREEEK